VDNYQLKLAENNKPIHLHFYQTKLKMLYLS